jgi:hypothetical protein
MGLSLEGQRLARLNFGEAVTRLNWEYQQKAKAVIDKTLDGLGQKTALRQLYVEWLKKKSEAFIDSWLGSWQAAGTVPTDLELEELHSCVAGGFFGGAPGFSVHPLPPLTVQRVRVLEADMHNRLEKKVLEMKLQAAKPQQPNYQMNISQNYGPVQQGADNTQEIKTSDETKSRS